MSLMLVFNINNDRKRVVLQPVKSLGDKLGPVII